MGRSIIQSVSRRTSECRTVGTRVTKDLYEFLLHEAESRSVSLSEVLRGVIEDAAGEAARRGKSS